MSKQDMKQERTTHFPGKPRRLKEIFQNVGIPLFFVTLNSWNRMKILANQDTHSAFRAYALKNGSQGRVFGRYVIMPDHIHLFTRLKQDDSLSTLIRLLKQSLSQTLASHSCRGPYWQDGFFDHVLRSSESYAEKWEYVKNNPVRAGLVENWEDWPYQGEIDIIDRA